MKTSNVILGVLAGAAVGAVIGILFAPCAPPLVRTFLPEDIQHVQACQPLLKARKGLILMKKPSLMF